MEKSFPFLFACLVIAPYQSRLIITNKNHLY